VVVVVVVVVVSMDKAYRKYGDFRRPVVCAVKLFRAYFGNFEFTICLAKLNNLNCSK
jgi:hypothetical protein